MLSQGDRCLELTSNSVFRVRLVFSVLKLVRIKSRYKLTEVNGLHVRGHFMNLSDLICSLLEVR
jgi:hypothetical protein